LYRVLKTGSWISPNTAVAQMAVDYVIVDRPWINGTPDSTSTVELFAFRNGTVSDDGGVTSDIGRYVFNVLGVTADGVVRAGRSLSLYNMGYGYTNMITSGFYLVCPIAKKIFDITGNPEFVDHPAFKFYTDVIGGYDKWVGDGSSLGTTPKEQRINNIGWDELFVTTQNPNLIDKLANNIVPIMKEWLGASGDIGFGYGGYDRIPGYNLQYNALGLANVLSGFGKPGGTDYNYSGATDSADVAWFLSKWGQ